MTLCSQDCDIAQDYEKRASGGEPRDLNGLLLFEAQNAKSLFIEKKDTITKYRRERIEQNTDERFHYLESCPAELDIVGDSLPALVVDFKRFFTIPPDELYRQAASAHGALRRTRLASPYREHIQSRMTFYGQRVMLPLAHRKLSAAISTPTSPQSLPASTRAGATVQGPAKPDRNAAGQ